MKQVILTILLFPLLGCLSYGENHKKHTCRVLFLDRPASMPKTLHLFDGVTSREVDLPSWNLSQIYEMPPGPLELTMLSSPLDDPKKIPAGAPTATVPEGAVDFYLLVRHDPENKVVPVKIIVIQAGVADLTPGQMLWVNLTDLKVDGKLGTETLVVEPQSQVIMGSPVSGSADYPVSLTYRISDKEEAYPICETRWAHNSQSRAIAFIFPKVDSPVPRVSVFLDFREDKERKSSQPVP